MRKNIGKLSIAVFMLAMTFSGCSNKDINVADLQKQLQSKEDIIAKQQKDVAVQNAELALLKERLQKEQAKRESLLKEQNELIQEQESETSSSNSGEVIENTSLVPPNAKAGECYAKVLTPQKYTTTTELKLLSPKYEKLSVTKPTYKDVTYKIIEKAESFKYVVTPATYKCVENKVMIKPEKITYKVIPATFKEVQEKVMISPAQKVWKKGSGAITKVNHTTGDIMCLVEVPAKYKTITKTVVDVPATTQKIITPAQYIYVRAKAVEREASYEKVVIPATYKTLSVQELDRAAKINREEVQEVFQTYDKKSISKPSELRWERILCETNTNEDVIKRVQQELVDRDYNIGSIDGVYGTSTQKALEAFQKDNQLPSGALTLETLDALGVE